LPRRTRLQRRERQRVTDRVVQIPGQPVAFGELPRPGLQGTLA
jgi:hypothetical protein